MKNIVYVFGVLLCLAFVPFVSAGSISNDFTNTDEVCVNYESYCASGHYKHGKFHCDSYKNKCVEYEDVGSDGVVNSDVVIDANTLNGLSDEDILNDAKAYSDSKPDLRGGGVSSTWVKKIIGVDDNLLDNFGSLMRYIDSLYVRQSEYDLLKHKVDLMETIFIANGVDFNSTDLELANQKRVGNNIKTICKVDSEGFEHCVVKK